jgi:hypothetical protein
MPPLVCRPAARPFVARVRRACVGRPVRPRAALDPAELTGHALGAFVLFYSSLQWAWLRRLRRDFERRK